MNQLQNSDTFTARLRKELTWTTPALALASWPLCRWPYSLRANGPLHGMPHLP